MSSARAAPGAVRQRGPQGTGVPEDHPAPRLRETAGSPGLHPQTDQQHLPQVREPTLLFIAL